MQFSSDDMSALTFPILVQEVTQYDLRCRCVKAVLIVSCFVRVVQEIQEKEVDGY